jgi:23S rRNA (adenine2503-C2)-methyltransferase
MDTATARTNLLGLTRDELEAFVTDMGEKPFRARQLMKWIYRRGVADIGAMTDLGKGFRERLSAVAEIRVPEVMHRQVSGDGTRKWLLRFEGDQAIEMVFIPEPGRGTLCISSQVGCAMDCTFCSTAQQGFNRNLDVAEIAGQVWLANRELEGTLPLLKDSHRSGRTPLGKGERPLVTNVVFMGMGEPLANYRNVVPAAEIMMDDHGFDLSRRRVTVSTSGLVPQMRRIAEETNVALAVSLHAPNDALRSQLVPINRRHPIAELLAACWHYVERQNARNVTFEYVMLDGVNDRQAHARELAALLKGRPAKVNLIPFNPFPGTRYRRSPEQVIASFRDRLLENGVIATVRRTRGDDIDAACGQLVGRVADRTTSRLGDRLGGIPVVAA